MKSIQLFIIFFACCAISFHSNAQDKGVVEDTITVEGVCGMCKERIEEAAYGKGVKFASWDKNSKQLVLAYRSDKTSLEEVEGRIAAAGHKTENTAAKKDDYESLPDCCKYEHVDTH